MPLVARERRRRHRVVTGVVSSPCRCRLVQHQHNNHTQHTTYAVCCVYMYRKSEPVQRDTRLLAYTQHINTTLTRVFTCSSMWMCVCVCAVECHAGASLLCAHALSHSHEPDIIRFNPLARIYSTHSTQNRVIMRLSTARPAPNSHDNKYENKKLARKSSDSTNRARHRLVYDFQIASTI